MFEHDLLDVGPTGTAKTISQMHALYASGQLIKAFRLGEAWGHPTQWPTTDAKIIGGRILSNLGAPRLGRQLHVQAFRRDPAQLEAKYYFTYCLLERRGPLAAIEFWEKQNSTADAGAECFSDWLAMRGTLASIYRDFENAESYLLSAEKISPDKPWIRLERARVQEGQDCYEQALETAKSSLDIHPWHRSGVHYVAHLLQVLDRDEQALDLLEQASERIESALLMHQLAALQDHLHQHGKALKTLERIKSLCPLPEPKFMQSVAWVRSNVAYYAGDFAAAADFAEASKHEFMLKVAEKLRAHVDQSQKHPRVVLEFPFVRQHHMTCAPATMAAVGRFWNKPTDHLSVVDAICYDGTACYSQRLWANKNGWASREFTLSWDATVALIDRGIPFMLATTQVNSGHLQAVIGYDQMRGTILCRDPYQYYLTEFHAQLFLEQQAGSGPRAMVIVPETQSQLLTDIELPDSHLYDQLHEVERLLAAHNRAGAAAAYAHLTEIAPEHRITFQARRALAAYDNDSVSGLDAVDGLLKLYPKDIPLLFSKALILRSLERTDLLLPLLEKECGNHLVQASFLHLYADQLQKHTGDRSKVISLLKRALRRHPTHAQSLISLGHQFWSQRKLEKATLLYQVGASIDSMNEGSVQTYFIASRHLKKTDSALAMLKKRADRLIKRSSLPAQTYFWALELLNKTTQAFEALSEAQQNRPEDGDLLLYAADAYGRRANSAKARELLQAAVGKTRQSQWLREAARLSTYDGNLLEALAQWNQVLETEPLASDANREVAQLIAQTQSPDAAAQHLAKVQERFPFNIELAQNRIIWLRSRGHAAVVEAAEEFVTKHPANVWGRVELSLSLAELGKNEQALAQAQAAINISPDAPNAHFARANALERMLQLDAAREAYRQALRISIDYSIAIQRLVESYSSNDQKVEALLFVHQEIMRQVVFGEGLLTYRNVAAPILDSDTLLAFLQDARTIRPDLWQAWSAVVYQLCKISRLDEAMQIAKEAVDRFPLLPRVWYDLSYVAGLKADRPGKISALNQCLSLSPGWSFAARQLADTHRLQGNDDETVAVLERAINRDPLEAANYHAYAQQLWGLKKKDQAIEQAKKAVVLNPWLSDAWQSLHEWLKSLGKENDMVTFTREACRQRAGEPIAWQLLARILHGPDTLVERIAACDSAIALDPLNIESHDQKVRLLIEQNSYDAALAACDPPQFAGNPPVELRGRKAWIIAQQKNIPQAIALMNEILQSNQTYYWGWLQLVNWLSKQKKPQEYLSAVQAMVKQFPHDNVARNHLSSAQAQNKDSQTAKQTLIGALNVAPDNPFALRKLFDSQINDKEFTAAAETLTLIQRHLVNSEFLHRQAVLAAANRDAETAVSALTQLCTADGFEIYALSEAVKAMDGAKMQRQVNETFNQIASNDRNLPAGVVGFWAQRAGKSRQWKACRSIMQLFEPESEQWLESALAYIDELTKAKEYTQLNRFIRKQQKRAKIQTRLWGKIGFALFAQNKLRQTIRAMKDWPDRNDAHPWMMLNLAHAYRRSNANDLARNVHRFALKLEKDQTTLKHTVWLAVDEVIAGREEENYKSLSTAETPKLDKHYPYLLNLARALSPLCDGKEKPTPQQFKAARKAIAAARKTAPGWSTQRELRITMRRAVGRLVECQPTLSNRLWQVLWMLRTTVVLRK
jgi:tetratricopeptide (TPR) repeat protein